MSKKKQKQKPAPCQRGFASRPRQEKRFDAQGRRIGDDGLPMTKYRTRAHRLLNGFFVWGAFAGLLCAGFTVLATFQGQELSSWELVAEGGAYRNGLSIATLLRFEALFCLAVGYCIGGRPSLRVFLALRWIRAEARPAHRAGARPCMRGVVRDGRAAGGGVRAGVGCNAGPARDIPFACAEDPRRASAAALDAVVGVRKALHVGGFGTVARALAHVACAI